MRLFPIPNNPYRAASGSGITPIADPSDRDRTWFATTPLTPFDLDLTTNPPDPQDTILAETTRLRDAAMLMPWLGALSRPPLW